MRVVLVGRDPELERVIGAPNEGPAAFQITTLNDLSDCSTLPDAGDLVVIDVCPEGVARVDRIRAVLRGAPHARVVAVTEYPSVSLAMATIKAGASSCLSRPVHLVDLLGCLQADTASAVAGSISLPSLDEVEWAYIRRVLDSVGGNVSKAAQILRIQRSTLQRRLKKGPPGGRNGRQESAPSPRSFRRLSMLGSPI